MSRQLLDELRTRPLDAAGLNRLRAIDTKITGELLTDLDPDLRQELQRLVQPLTSHTERSDGELRLAYAQLVGWLEGHLRTAESAPSDRHATLAVDGASASSDNAPSPYRDRPDADGLPVVDVVDTPFGAPGFSSWTGVRAWLGWTADAVRVDHDDQSHRRTV